MKLGILTALPALLLGSSIPAATEPARQLEKEIAAVKLDGLLRTAIGVTRQDTPIPAFISEADLDFETEKHRILLVGGLDGNVESTRAVLKELEWFQTKSKAHERFIISAVPCARPDHLGTQSISSRPLPPEGRAYHQPENDIDHYLWRWTGMHAPDLVIEILATEGDSRIETLVSVSDVEEKIPLLGDLPAVRKLFSTEGAAASFAEAFTYFKPAETGEIPALRAHIRAGEDNAWLESFLESRENRISTGLTESVSPARRELQRRVARSPVEVAGELAQVYGRRFDSIMYIPSLAVIGRIRLGELTNDPEPLAEAEKLAAPFRSGEKESMPAKGNGSTLSGHLVFSELARRTGDETWKALARKAADYGFDEAGKPKEAMPFHNEMSDSVFMGCAILAEVGALTGETKYFDQCLRHLKFMQELCLRDDGIYRHSPLDEAAWGRGNGFPALGMALSLSALPEDSEAFAYFLESYRAHLEALRKHQDPTGMWHQVIDHEESYREFTSTCMITFAIVRGIRRGWLDEKEWAPVVEKSWRAIKSRIGPKGRLVDVCTGTGKQKNLRAYFDRTAILGPDDRGGAMALMVSTEIAQWKK